MYAGRHVEAGTVDDAFYAPRHPYTLGLLASLPRLDRRSHGTRLYRIKGQPPSLIEPTDRLHLSSALRLRDIARPCATEVPGASDVGPGHTAMCHNWRLLEG